MLLSKSHGTLKVPPNLVSCYSTSPVLPSKSHATLKVTCYSQSPMPLSKSHATMSKSYSLGYPGIYGLDFSRPAWPGWPAGRVSRARRAWSTRNAHSFQISRVFRYLRCLLSRNWALASSVRNLMAGAPALPPGGLHMWILILIQVGIRPDRRA